MTTFYKEWQLNSIFIVCASTKAGKTHLTKKIIRELPVHNIIIFSPTLDLSGDWEEFKESEKWDKTAGLSPDTPMIKKFSIDSEFPDLIKKVIDSQEAIIKKDTKKKTPLTLMVFDDTANSPIMKFKGILDKIAISLRHYNISAIVIAQRISSIPRQLRINASYFIIMSCYNLSEIEKFLEEFVLRKHKKHIHSILNDIFSKPYNYLVSDNLNPIISKRLWKNGHDLIEFDDL